MSTQSEDEAGNAAKRLDDLQRGQKTAEFLIRLYTRRLKRKNLSDDLREETELSLSEQQDELERIHTSFLVNEPGVLSRPSKWFYALHSKFLPPLPSGALMGRGLKMDMLQSQHLHWAAIRMCFIFGVITIGVPFLLPWTGITPHNWLRDLFEGSQLSWLGTIVPGIILCIFINTIDKSSNSPGVKYQTLPLFITQLFYTGAESWGRGEKMRVHFIFALSAVPSLLVSPVWFIVLMLLSDQLMRIYIDTYREMNNRIIAAQTTAIVLKTWFLLTIIIGVVVSVVISSVGLDDLM